MRTQEKRAGIKEPKKLSVMENLVWNSAGSFTYLICQWLLTLIVVRGSGNFAFAGILSLAISVTNIFYNVACFNVRPYQISDLTGRYRTADYCAFRAASCAAAFLGCAVYALAFGYDREQVSCILLYMAFKLGEAWADLLHGFEQRAYRMDIGGISLFCRGILSLVSFALTLRLTESLSWSLAAMGAATLLFIALYDMRMARGFARLSFRTGILRLREMFLEFLPLTAGSFLNTLGASLPRQVLEGKFGNEALGIYGTVATPAVIVQVAASYIFNPVLTEFARLKQEGKKKAFLRLTGKISLLLGGLSLAALAGGRLLGRWGLALLYGEEIAGYASVFHPVLLYTCLNAFVWFLWNLLIVLRRLKALLWISAAGVALCIASMFPLVERFGMDGVSYSLILYCLVVIALMLGLLAVSVKKKF